MSSDKLVWPSLCFGTLARRSGQKAFPSQHSTVAVDPPDLPLQPPRKVGKGPMEEAIDVVAKQLKEKRVAAEQALQAFNDGALAKSRRDATLELADKRVLSKLESQWRQRHFGIPPACTCDSKAKRPMQKPRASSQVLEQGEQSHKGMLL